VLSAAASVSAFISAFFNALFAAALKILYDQVAPVMASILNKTPDWSEYPMANKFLKNRPFSRFNLDFNLRV